MDVGQDRNAAEIVEAICDMRQIIGNCLIKLLAGSRKGSFKVSLSIMPKDFEVNENHGGRTFYSEGSFVGNAHVQDVKESWENCKTLWDLAK